MKEVVPEEIVLRTAHDVRHLRTCARCERLGDNRNMVEMIPSRPDDRWHPHCFYKEFGERGVLDLRTHHLGKFRICDVPKKLMRKLVEKFIDAD